MLGFIQGVSGFITGGYGVALIALAVMCCFLASAAQFAAPRLGFIATGCGSAAFLVAYLVRTYMAGGGIGAG